MDDGWQQISQRFTDAGAGFHDEAAVPFQSGGYPHGHLLLFGPVLKVIRPREQPVVREDLVDALGERSFGFSRHADGNVKEHRVGVEVICLAARPSFLHGAGHDFLA
jgi:hypothetical protein